MAFQAGSIKISGTIDGLSFYNSVFGWLVRRKGGPGRRQFKTSPAFARSRENSAEFTACATAAAKVRRAVLTATGIRDKTLYHRLVKLMRQLANDDKQSLRGRRDPQKGMQTAQGRTRLKSFELSQGLCLYDLLLKTGFLREQDEERITKAPATTGNPSPLTRKHPKERAFRLPVTNRRHIGYCPVQTTINTASG